MTSFIGNIAHTDVDGTIYYHGFRRNSLVISPLMYVLFKDPGSSLELYGKVHSVFQTIGGEPSCEIQVFTYVPDDEMRTDGSAFDECYVVHGDTITVELKNVSSQEVNVVWVPPEIADEDLVSYVDAHLGDDEYPDSGADDSEEDEDRDFIVKGEQWAFVQYAIDAEKPGEVFYAPPPQFTDAWMSKTKDDGMDGDLARYVRDHFWEPAVQKRWPGVNPAALFLQEKTDDYCDAFRAAFMQLVHSDASIREAHALCLDFKLNDPAHHQGGKRKRL